MRAELPASTGLRTGSPPRRGTHASTWALVGALLVALTTFGSASATTGGPSCRTAFAGCRTHRQKVRYCHAACVTTRTVCENAFIKGRLKRRCRRRALRACLGSGGSCIHACDATHPCGEKQQCFDGQCIMAEPCKTACGTGCCGGDYPHCGPDLRCWTKPCDTVCGDTCCGGHYPYCGPDQRCWRKPCETLCGETCCGGDAPICDAGTCRPGTPSGGGFPTDLPPGTYALTVCISGTVSLPCQSAGTIPFAGLAQFEAAIAAALDQWLAATAGTPDCTRGATTYSAFDGSAFTATATATCGKATETLRITVQLL